MVPTERLTSGCQLCQCPFSARSATALELAIVEHHAAIHQGSAWALEAFADVEAGPKRRESMKSS